MMKPLATLALFGVLGVLCGCTTTAAPATMTWRATITDSASGAPVAGDIGACPEWSRRVDDVRAVQAVTQADVPLPADGQKHRLRVEAAGYQRWEIEIAGQTQPGRVVLGPVKLIHA